jgi:group II intron reverse transcriptase/maturase
VLAGRLAIGRYHWIVEADIRGFFDRIDHDWLLRMIGERVKDAAFVGLIAKWLKAGVLEEDGKTVHPVTGTPQGGIISPVLANIYLHYALDLWFERKVRPRQRGQAMLMRYADDFVCAFEDRGEAEAFMGWLSERLGKFGLELAGEKSGLVRFSRHAMKDNGGFRFLGFLYHWTLSRNGKPKVQRMTDPRKLQASVAAFSEWIQSKRHQRAHRVMAQLQRKLAGYWNYYGVTGNSRSLGKYWWSVLGLLYKWLNRRSHKRSYTWKGLMACLEDFKIPKPRITEKANANDQGQQLWFVFAN